MLRALGAFLTGSLRGRLILSVAAVHAVLMALFVADLTIRQRSMLLDRQTEQAIALSEALAASSAGWIAADDLSGLQEIVDVQRRYPEVTFAIIIDEQGRVLADMDPSRRGLFVQDLPREPKLSVISRTPSLVDVAAPAIIGGQPVGWARVGIGQKAAGEKLAAITRNGVLYALAAIAVGSLLAWLMGRQVTDRLYIVQETINAIRSGDHRARCRVSGTDEAALIGSEFNSMLDTLAERDSRLQESEARYRSLIQKVRTAIVLHDAQGRIVDSNPLAEELLGLSKDQLLGKTLIDPAWHFVREDGSVMPVDEYPAARVLATHSPLRDFVAGISHPDRAGIGWVLVNAEPEPDEGGETGRVLVSFVDITERKRAEEALRESERQVRRKLDAILSPETDIGALELSDIIDSDRIQNLMNQFYRLTRMGIGIIDLHGRVLVGTGWQEICTKFHRQHPESCRLCIESDIELSTGVPPGTFKQYRCKNNMWDMSTPIMLGDRHVGNIFLGQFLFEDETPDYDVFRGQADRYGFNVDEYLAALDRVPRWSQETVNATMSFYAEFAGMIGTLSYSNIKLASALDQRRRAEEALRRLNRELRAISECNQALMRAVDEQTLLHSICRIICDAGYRMAWVGYRENDEARTIRPVGWAGFENGYLEQAGITWADTERGRGPSGVAIRTGMSSGIQDFLTDPRGLPWREAALQRGYRSSISMPLKDEGATTFGILTIYSTEPNAFTEDEQRLLEELSADLAFGITVLRARIERQRAEEGLRLANERFSLAARAAPLGVWDWDIHKNELVWDDGMYELYGVSREDFSGAYEAWLKGIHPDDRAASDEISKQARTGEREYDTEFRVIWPDGSIRHLKAYGQVVRDADGNPLRMTGVNFDITERRQAEEEIRRLNQDLEQRVADRTVELESTIQELETFAYSVSHDLRAPLRHVDGMLGLLKKRIGPALDEESRRYMATASRASLRMAALIDDLLSFSQMGRRALADGRVDMESLAREILHDFDPETQGRTINWRLGSLPVVRGDRAMLRMVLVNLISNALKFTQPRDRSEIEIGCTPAQQADQTVIFVRDNGVGFDMQYVDKLFGVFQRLHGVDEFEGTGIGLANVRRIIGRHGGRTWAEGKVNEGATFYFSLPLAEAGGA